MLGAHLADRRNQASTSARPPPQLVMAQYMGTETNRVCPHLHNTYMHYGTRRTTNDFIKSSRPLSHYSAKHTTIRTKKKNRQTVTDTAPTAKLVLNTCAAFSSIVLAPFLNSLTRATKRVCASLGSKLAMSNSSRSESASFFKLWYDFSRDK
jgi:hypothetical protein